MKLHTYCITPIDFGWEFCPTLDQYIAKQAENEKDGSAEPGAVKKCKRDFEKAKEAARKKGWEGDIRGDAHVFLVPDELEFAYGFVWKQENNGTTFVVSPVPLPNLKIVEC